MVREPLAWVTRAAFRIAAGALKGRRRTDYLGLVLVAALGACELGSTEVSGGGSGPDRDHADRQPWDRIA